jgi:hypothetical protein
MTKIDNISLRRLKFWKRPIATGDKVSRPIYDYYSLFMIFEGETFTLYQALIIRYLFSQNTALYIAVDLKSIRMAY